MRAKVFKVPFGILGGCFDLGYFVRERCVKVGKYRAYSLQKLFIPSIVLLHVCIVHDKSIYQSINIDSGFDKHSIAAPISP
jgi:hypothetical protein